MANKINYDKLIEEIINLTLDKIQYKQEVYTFLISRLAVERLVQFELAYTAQKYFNEHVEQQNGWKAYIEVGHGNKKTFNVGLLTNKDLPSLKEKIKYKSANDCIIIELKAYQGPTYKKPPKNKIQLSKI